ncbi:serine/threonine-protein kinase ULK3 isoform X2 [Canis lupus familiaris]|uniref:serine/threonine-protein kinase ULK3 isoform X2 n=1 Tax=Canis lupus familiaris TaxID=9615 RepID=UPI0015F172CF|nr:serine/threonine-protein kinase ULK3 isoform X2 [Canis lupus familiaris]
MAGPGWGPPRLDGFILTERLGSGTYATVYKAYAKDTREVVAIKCVAKKSLNKASVENLLTEIEILKGIRHPHIVQLRDFQLPSACRAVGQRPHLPHHGVLRRGRPVPLHPHPQASAREGGSRLHAAVGALQFLHEQNISHLDLKPQNILLSSLEKPHLKLADFGFAQHMSPWDEKHVLRGSPLYMAPEMVCQRQYDARVDLWSVGVILYEALFGQPPFASRSFTELEEKIRSNRVIELPLRPPLSRDCRDLLQRLLERDPNRRISFQDFFAHPWVDLEHMPSGESLARATALVVQAVKKDQDGDAAAALSLYCKALDFFVPALHYEVDAQRKEAIKAKVGEGVSQRKLAPSRDLRSLALLQPRGRLSQGGPGPPLQPPDVTAWGSHQGRGGRTWEVGAGPAEAGDLCARPAQRDGPGQTSAPRGPGSGFGCHGQGGGGWWGAGCPGPVPACPGGVAGAAGSGAHRPEAGAASHRGSEPHGSSRIPEGAGQGRHSLRVCSVGPGPAWLPLTPGPPVCPTDEGVSLGSRDPGQGGTVRVRSYLVHPAVTPEG